MELAFKCLAVTHTSGRVTLTPLELPHLAVHGRTLDEARFELTLALDDQIGRSHPKHLWRYCKPGDGALVDLDVTLLPLSEKKHPLPLLALETAAHAGHTEARVFTANARYWFKAKGKELAAQATALLTEQLKDLGVEALLEMRREGKAALVDLVIDVKPLRLSDLKRKELYLDARPPPIPPEDVPKRDPDDDNENEDDLDDDWADAKKKKKQPEKKEVPTPTLNRLAVKWHELAKDFPATFGRDALAEQVRAHVTSKEPEPLLLLGPAGVGKTAVLHETARKLGKTAAFFFLDSSRLIAGQGGFGDWQRQTLDAFAEARAAKAVLHLGRLIDLLDAGKSAHSDDNVAQLIIPTLAGREVAVLAEATPEEWARVRDRHQSFARLFSPISIDEPAPNESQDIITRIAGHEGPKRNVRAASDAIDEVRQLVKRFRPYGSQLGNSIAFLRRLLDGAAHARQTTLGRLDVIRRFCVESGVPEELLRDDLPLDPAEVRAFLSARVKGQGAAVERVAQVVSIVKANLADPSRPVATLFFAGPTGVGKTELSKALAERVFGSKDRLVRLDMGEYSGPDALARLIGGTGAEGHLAAAVRRQPFSIVLLDEIEKAHPAVFDALLSVLGEGRLTDGRGRLTDFRSTLIVMTSNLGADTLRARVGFSGSGDEVEGMRVHYLAEARRFFRPELFNRLDDVVVFSPLSRENLSLIVDRELKKVAARSGFQKLDVALALGDDVVSTLAERGYEPRYGARPLKRVLERQLVAPAAAHLSAHRPPGAARLDVTVEDQKLAFAAHALPRAADGVSRAALLELCEEAAGLRAEVRAWQRAPLMAELKQTLAMFERLSLQPAYWKDRVLADEQSRKAGAARELVDSFDKLRAQAEAAEELVFEAYCSRAGAAAQDLSIGLAGAREAFEPLTEKLFACLYPPMNAATVTLMPGRGAHRWALWLLDTYRHWAVKRELTHETRFLAPKTPEQLKAQRLELEQKKKVRRTSGQEVERVLQQQGVIAAIKVYRDKTGVSLVEAKAYVDRLRAAQIDTEPESHEWRVGVPVGNAWGAIAFSVFGEGLPMLLSAEHGAHHVHDSGEAFSVKVRFQPGHTRTRELDSLEQLEVVMPGTEIRRVWPVRKGQEHGVLKDLRTGTEHRASYGGFELGQVLAAWVRHRVFGAQEPSWT